MNDILVLKQQHLLSDYCPLNGHKTHFKLNRNRWVTSIFFSLSSTIHFTVGTRGDAAASPYNITSRSVKRQHQSCVECMLAALVSRRRCMPKASCRDIDLRTVPFISSNTRREGSTCEQHRM